MKRKFGKRPSIAYLDISELDQAKNLGLKKEIINGLGQILTVNGFAVSSNFVINLAIRIRGDGGLFDKDWHTYSTDFPIYIRSKPLAREHLADVEQLGLLPQSLKQNKKNLATHFKFIHDSPIILPGCTTAYEQLKERREFMSRIV